MLQETYAVRAKALRMEEVMQKAVSLVIPFVGKGHHAFLATVCKEWQEHYSVAYPSGETTFSSIVESVERLHWAKGYGYELSVGTFRAAAEYGDVSVCEELHSLECPWDEEACKAAVRNARHGLRILKWLRFEDVPRKRRCLWSETGMGIHAVKCDNVEVLEWLLKEGFMGPPDSNMWSEAVLGGCIPMLQMIVHQPKVRAQMEAATGLSKWRAGPSLAANEGNLQVLQWLHANARELCRWDEHVCCWAVRGGKSLPMLKWLRSEEVRAPWDEWTCPQFVKDISGLGWGMPADVFEEMKQWVHANGHPCHCQD